ncbi:ABC transporter ATP-binding protein [Spiractinospora alimapuensis]|nr:ABC transporter ATP-binding protein [Spiractinospora alimapuensis]
MFPIARIDVQGLHVRYDELTAVDGLTFSVGAGEIYGLLGRNGAGKTSTISAVAGLLEPWAGECDVLGRRVVVDSPALRQALALQPQKANLFPRLRVRETLEMWGALYGNPRSVPKLIDELGLSEKAETRVAKLSGGQQQRLLIGTALVGNTPIVVLDEPTTGLDPHARHAVWRIVRDAQAAGTTFLLSTHAMDEAEEICDRLAIMHKGQFVTEGVPADLVEKHCPGGVVRVRTKDPTVTAALAELYGEDAVVPSTETGGRDWVQIRVANPYTAAERINDRHGPLDIRPRLSTLEDVFLKMTGTSLSAGDSELPEEATV